jgi:hypothetical protein
MAKTSKRTVVKVDATQPTCEYCGGPEHHSAWDGYPDTWECACKHWDWLQERAKEYSGPCGKCKECGRIMYVMLALFTGLRDKWNWRNKYCFRCARQRELDRLKARYTPVTHKKRRCENCRKWFQPKRSTAKYCSTKCRVYAKRTAVK